jgi:predicted nucleic acid-binding protein
MKYVLDASVALCQVIPRPHSLKALQLRDEFLRNVHDLIAPSTFTAEVASGLTKSERQKIIPTGQAEILLSKILNAPPVILPYDPLLRRATRISSQTRSGLLDCLYVALAEREGCVMVTVDDKLLRNLGSQFSFVKHLSTI